jgi:GNAT superfamily N-acetyltransferase
VIELRDVPAESLPARQADATERLVARRVATRFVDPEDARAEAGRAMERLATTSTFLDVADQDGVHGWLWLGDEGEELMVHDLVLDEPGRAAELLPLLLERARDRGARMLSVGVAEDDAARAALGAQPGFTVRATNMVLDLDQAPPDPAPLTLDPMTAEEFDGWVGGQVEGYAVELAATGMSEESARERSRTQMAELIPDGVASPGMEFFFARVDGEVVGSLWLNSDQTMAFVYDIEVDASQRRRGYGAAIMNAAARYCREQGHPYLGLNVFGHNLNARALYDKLGYRVTFDYLALDLPDAG